ncbi:MAG: hypothetical protein Satyrvirus8_19 [Satyrvirus sp.]|uniref:Uncharacterized protein n=1 Tax=Satyrvirus sp. TaxID=2487771 RepID=A0A3G5AG55_9VIRU|nr:MAG: hypothetical protein Satyrvirus8_19 [Satyrvirus sp.]
MYKKLINNNNCSSITFSSDNHSFTHKFPYNETKLLKVYPSPSHEYIILFFTDTYFAYIYHIIIYKFSSTKIDKIQSMELYYDEQYEDHNKFEVNHVIWLSDNTLELLNKYYVYYPEKECTYDELYERMNNDPSIPRSADPLLSSINHFDLNLIDELEYTYRKHYSIIECTENNVKIKEEFIKIDKTL